MRIMLQLPNHVTVSWPVPARIRWFNESDRCVEILICNAVSIRATVVEGTVKDVRDTIGCSMVINTDGSLTSC